MGQCPEHDELFEYALDGMEESQRDTVRKHLTRCNGCVEQIREYALVTEGLALKAEPVDVPAGLEGAVMERIRRDKASTADQFRLTGWAMFWMRLGPVFALMSVVMTAAAFLAMRSATVSPPANMVAVDDHRVVSLMTNPSVRTVSLKDAGGMGGCKGTLTCAKNSEFLLVSFENLKTCPSGRVYTMWLSDDAGNSHKIATFDARGQHAQTALIDMGHKLDMAGPMKVEVRLQRNQDAKPDGELHLMGGIEL